MKIKTFFLIVCLFLVSSACQQKDETPELPPPEIPVIITSTQEVSIYQDFVGHIYGAKDIAIRARVEGFLEKIHFDEGFPVKAGQLLYTIESQPFEADVAAKMSKVAEAKTMLAKATSDLNRTRPLAEQKAVSQSDLDAAVAQYEASVASVEAANANLRASKIQLGYTKIYSPLNGIIGKTQAKVGDFVGRSPNPVILNMVSNIESALVEFFITESQYLQLSRNISTRVKVDDTVDREANLELILADSSIYKHKGTYNFLDRSVDPTTGAILIQASFPNPDGILRPGLFGKVRAKVDLIKDGILIPQRCVIELQGNYTVFVVTENNKVEERDVDVGPTVKSYWLVLEGLKAGEKVVYEGLQSVGDGSIVNPVVQDIKFNLTEDQ